MPAPARPPPETPTMTPLPAPVTRRRFLQAGAAAAVGLAGLPALADDEKKKSDDFNGFIVGVQSYTFRNFKLEQCLKRTQELGLRHIEFYRGHVAPDSTPEQVQAVLRLCGE